MPTRPVLVTGAAGFIGSHVTERLTSMGRRVVGLDDLCDAYDPQLKRRNLAPSLAGDRFELVQTDIRDRQGVLDAFETHRPETVIHLAARAGVRPSIEQPALYAGVNIDGTVHLLDAAVRHGCEKFIFASSSSVYGNNESVPFCEVDRVDHPISPYAATKKAGELICHTYWHLHGLPIFCLRFFTVYGPRQRPDLAISRFLHLIRDGRPLDMYGDGSTSRDYTYIGDIVSGVVAALERCDRFRIYNLGSHNPIRLRDLIETVESVTGQSAEINPLPMPSGDVNRTWADLTRSGAELGYAPGTRLIDGIAKQWEWMEGESDGATERRSDAGGKENGGG